MDRRPRSRVVLAGLALWLVSGLDAAHARRPADRSRRVQTGVASFYGRKEAGKQTANGDHLALQKMTAASPTLPLGTVAKVTNTASGRSTDVTITDRGPYVAGRVIDVTPKAAARIGITKDQGLAAVTVKPVSEPASPPE